MSIATQIKAYGERAKHAASQLQTLTQDEKNNVLQAMAQALVDHQQTIIKANQKDIQNAEKNDLSPALIDRLMLDEARIRDMAAGMRHVAMLPDPVHKVLHEHKKNNGLLIQKIRTPIGVIGMIYESRPNVTADVTALCLKTANAIILRGGKEALHSNETILEVLLAAGYKAGLPKHAAQLITSTDHEAVKHLLQLTDYVDLIIPRGGEGLINMVIEHARVPVIKHYKGLCHLYVDQTADINMALNICENAKVQRPGVCNAIETLLVHETIAREFLPALKDLLQKRDVELRGDETACQLCPDIQTASEADWHAEYLDLILAIKVVSDVQAAVQHINHYGSHHSDAIVTQDNACAQYFSQAVDSAAVYINASTRFTDGAEFGMGAEIGISTDKLHARGPMGLEELTTYKYIIQGQGQIRR